MIILAFLAGVFSTLSPCVLPLLPIVLGAALSEHRAGPLALALGLTISFAFIGMFIAAIGFSIGLDADMFRTVSAAMLIGIGLVLVVPRLQAKFATAAGSWTGWTDQRLGGFSTTGLKGQFGLGLLLGALWAPCVGPTLGAASLMAAQGENLWQAGTTMLIFGLGAAAPLLGIGMLSRSALSRWKGRLLSAGSRGKFALGVILIGFGALVITGLDKIVGTELVRISPAWLNDLTTRF